MKTANNFLAQTQDRLNGDGDADVGTDAENDIDGNGDQSSDESDTDPEDHNTSEDEEEDDKPPSRRGVPKKTKVSKTNSHFTADKAQRADNEVQKRADEIL